MFMDRLVVISLMVIVTQGTLPECGSLRPVMVDFLTDLETEFSANRDALNGVIKTYQKFYPRGKLPAADAEKKVTSKIGKLQLNELRNDIQARFDRTHFSGIRDLDYVRFFKDLQNLWAAMLQELKANPFDARTIDGSNVKAITALQSNGYREGINAKRLENEEKAFERFKMDYNRYIRCSDKTKYVSQTKKRKRGPDDSGEEPQIDKQTVRPVADTALGTDSLSQQIQALNEKIDALQARINLLPK